ncbi:MAG TPA: glutathione S-transferase family protein [Parvibaculum sp.]
MAQLRILSYLPNPRVWKSTIAGRLCGVDVEVRGATPGELAEWLWDFDAKPIAEVDSAVVKAAERAGRIGFKGQTLYKTDAFLVANPFGTVPVAFSPDGNVGIFESNSIMRAVARLGGETFPLYGTNPYEASRIDSFLDVSLVFATASQQYLFALRDKVIGRDVYERTRDSFTTYLGGLEAALASGRETFSGDGITLADICFACELALFHNEGPRAEVLASNQMTALLPEGRKTFPRAFAHFDRLVSRPEFAADLGPYLAKLTKRG